MRETKTTIIDFYQGAYGPAIRIDVQDIEWLTLFKENLIQLKNKNTLNLDLLNLKNVEKDEIAGFIIVLGLTIDLCTTPHTQSKHHSFIWTVDEERIEYIIGAVDQFLEHNNPGHYYLYEDDIDIELAFKE